VAEESQGVKDLRVGIAVAAVAVAIVGGWFLWAVGVIPSAEVIVMAVVFAVLAPFIVNWRVKEAARAKAMRASAFTRPPVPGTRRG
jgi:hypothetical protein